MLFCVQWLQWCGLSNKNFPRFSSFLLSGPLCSVCCGGVGFHPGSSCRETSTQTHTIWPPNMLKKCCFVMKNRGMSPAYADAEKPQPVSVLRTRAFSCSLTLPLLVFTWLHSPELSPLPRPCQNFQKEFFWFLLLWHSSALYSMTQFVKFFGLVIFFSKSVSYPVIFVNLHTKSSI